MAAGDPVALGALDLLAADSVADPIVRAIAQAERGTTGEIRVHLTRRPWERDPLAKCRRIFARFGMGRTRQRNAVLLYVNLRRHRFAVLADQGIDRAVGEEFWKRFSAQLSEDLRATHPERAIAIAVLAIGEKLTLHFPKEKTP